MEGSFDESAGQVQVVQRGCQESSARWLSQNKKYVGSRGVFYPDQSDESSGISRCPDDTAYLKMNEERRRTLVSSRHQRCQGGSTSLRELREVVKYITYQRYVKLRPRLGLMDDVITAE